MPESEKYYSRAGDATGVGVNYYTIDPTGIATVSPTRFKQGSNIVHDRIPFGLPATTAPAAGAYPVFSPDEGIWVVSFFKILQQTNGTSPTFDLLWAASGTAGGSGTTQLTGTVSGGSAGNNNKFVLGVLIASPTQAGPGNILWVNVGGTVTGFIGRVEGWVSRVA